MPTLAITGLANTGKSSLFGALTGRTQGVAPFPFSTTEIRIGTLTIENCFLGELARLENSDKVTPAVLEVVDTPPRNRFGGETDTEIIGKLRQADCLVAVLRSFHNPAVPAPGSTGDAAQQAQDTMVDLAINDAQVFDSALPRLRNQATSRPERHLAYQTAARALEITSEGGLLREESWADAEMAALADFAPLTLKPVLWVVNVDEADLGTIADPLGEVAPAGDRVVTLSLALEAEAAALDPEDRAEMREALGIGLGAAGVIGGEGAKALDLCTFITANHRETRAWLTPEGSSARAAAGRIHSDMERGFIRAEAADAASVIAAGGWDSARQEGITRVEGRDYQVRANDVLRIRFSV